MLEEAGFATVALVSVRAQAEKVRPPRALWTAGVLGRPLGEPEDAAFQHRVLRAALGLLERPDGPVILEDFPEDPPGLRDTEAWQPPEIPPWAAPSTSAGWTALLAREDAALAPLWQAAQRRFGRSSVGLSFQAPESWPDFLGAALQGALAVVPPLATPALALRFLCDDIKAFYGEAAQVVGAAPSPRQLDGWFWRHTAAGSALTALRDVAMASDNSALRTVGGRFFVPTHWLPESAGGL
jgi:hypothetical protein